MSAIYAEPLVSFLALDFKKPAESRLLLESLKRYVKFNHKVIYLHNGAEDYPYQFFKEGLIDQLIQTQRNNGLGIGTRDLYAASFSPYSITVQNDQYLAQDFTEEMLGAYISQLGQPIQLKDGEWKIASISLAGEICGPGIYSERAGLILTDFYKQMERNGLPYHGAGPFHEGIWREEAIQTIYGTNRFIHATHFQPLFVDNGTSAVRENPDGSIWKHFPDTKQLWLQTGPVKERHVYPKFNDEEWASVLATQSWPAGQIPANEVKDSFHVWH